MTLAEAEHAIEGAHPGWHVWHSRDGHALGQVLVWVAGPRNGMPAFRPYVYRGDRPDDGSML